MIFGTKLTREQRKGVQLCIIPNYVVYEYVCDSGDVFIKGPIPDVLAFSA